MKTYYQITCELYTEHVVPVINAKQYDSGRGVDITLTDCGAVVVPAVSDVCNLYCKKSDGTVSYISGTVNGSAVRVDFTNVLLAEAGVVECELEVTSGTDTVSTPVFRMVVLPSNYDQGAIQSQDEFTALEDALAQLSNIGPAAHYDVANNLTTAAAGSYVLDAAQGKALNDKFPTVPFSTTGYGGATDDANTVRAGVFYASNATQNLPVSTGGFLVTLVRSDSGGKVQFFFPALTAYTLAIFKRQYVYTSSTWTPWARINGTDVSQTPLGSIVVGTISLTASGNNNFATQGTITLPAGTYICTFGVVWPSSSAGRISAFITDSANSGTQVSADAQSRMNAVSGVTTNGNNGAFIYTASNNETLYLRTWQNTGASLTPNTAIFHAVKIAN